MKTLEEIIAALTQAATDLQAILDAEAPSQAQLDQAEQLMATIDDLEKQKAMAQKMREQKSINAARLADLKKPVHTVPGATNTGETKAHASQYGRRKSQYYPDNETAFKAGRFFQAVLGNNEAATKWCEEQGINFKTLTSQIEGGAGLFVIPEVDTAIIKLVEDFSVIRDAARVVSTTTESRTIWKRVSGNTAYFLTETGQPTSTDAAWESLKLIPKICGALTKYSLILDADAAIQLADEITWELAYALVVKEDQCAFVGDGTSTYGGIVGLSYKFRQVLEAYGGTWTTDAHKAYLGSAVVAAGNLFSEFTLQNFVDCTHKVARFNGLQPKWYIHDVCAAATIERLVYALSGNAMPNLADGLPPRFLGYPVVYTPAMPSTDANSQVAVLFGDLKMGSIFCDRQGVEINVNTQSETNFLGRTAQVLATERFDFMAHSVGNAHSTAASQTRGAIACIISQNS